jgi:hypothetical protein
MLLEMSGKGLIGKNLAISTITAKAKNIII